MEGKEEKVMVMMTAVVDSNPTYPERSSSLVSDSDSVEGTVDVCGDRGCVEEKRDAEGREKGCKNSYSAGNGQSHVCSALIGRTEQV